MSDIRSFAVKGMRCAGCARNLEKAVNSLPGAGKVMVNYATGMLILTGSEKGLADETVFAAVAKCGFKAEYPPADLREEEKKELQQNCKESFHLAVAAAFTILLSIIHWGKLFPAHPVNGIVQLVLLLPVLWAGRQIFISGIPALLRGRPEMDSLISCGAGTGIIYSLAMLFTPGNCHYHFEAAGMILTLVMLGRTLEGRARRKAAASMRELLRLAPETAILVTPEGNQEIPAAAIVPGQQLRVRPGDRMPADGTVISGSSDVDESVITGEELPIAKIPGSEVVCGTLNVDGALVIKVTASGEKSTLGRIIQLVSEAQSSRPPVAALADKVAGIFTWIIFSAAILTGVGWWIAGADFALIFNFSLSVMVAACPCALGLATPIALISGIGRGAGLGILFKNGTALELCARARAVIFDKTGTLTSGIPEVKKVTVIPESGIGEKEFMEAARIAEKNSNHPLAQAVAATGECSGEAEDFVNLPGFGIRCRISGKKWSFGNAAFLKSENISCFVPDGFSGHTLIFGACDGVFAGVIAAGDSLRGDAVATVAALRRRGLTVWMLTGDNPEAAKMCAERCGIGSFRADLRPEDKAAAVRELQRSGTQITVMVGDGINDAPALAQADVGVAIGSGTAAAMESADVVLPGSSLKMLNAAMELSCKCFAVIRQNLFWAFFYNFAAIPVAAGVFSAWGIVFRPEICAGAMAFSSLTVVLNALRLLRFKVKES